MNHDEEIRTMWRKQTDGATYTLEAARRDSAALQRTVSRRNTREYIGGAIAAACFLVFAWLAPTPLERIACLLVVAGGAYTAWQLRRRASHREPPASALAGPTLSFHRAELARQRDALASAWRWYVLPIVPGTLLLSIGTHLRLGGGSWAQWAVDATVGLVLAGVVWLNRRAAAHLQAEIDRLDRAAEGR